MADICPGCGDKISERYLKHGVCHNCYGTTDDPYMPRNSSEELIDRFMDQWRRAIYDLDRFSKIRIPGENDLAVALDTLLAKRDELQAKVDRVQAVLDEATTGANTWGTCGHEWLDLAKLREALA